MANANASRICHLLDIYDRHHGDEMNEEKGTRCNELMVLAKYLKYLQKYLQACLLRSGDRSTAVRQWGDG